MKTVGFYKEFLIDNQQKKQKSVFIIGNNCKIDVRIRETVRNESN